MMKIQIRSLALVLTLIQGTVAYYKDKLPMSFDMNTMNEYPTDFVSQGSAVPLSSKVKIIPEIPNQ